VTNHLLNNHKDTMDGQGSKPSKGTRLGLWLALGSVLILSSLLLGTYSHQVSATRIAPSSSTPLSQNLTLNNALSIPLQLPKVSPDNSAESVAGGDAPDTEWVTVNVKNGDTLGAIFSRIGVSADQLQNIVSLNADTASLKRLHPGESFKFKVDAKGQLQELTYDTDAVHILQVENKGDSYQSTVIERPIEHRLARASAVINSSLFEAAQTAGLADNITLKLTKIFGWDIDFALGIREGDSFAVVFEEDYVDGKKIRDGEILAAEFKNRGKTYRALRYTDPNGQVAYYAPNGGNLRKAFLQTPVEFSRISSGFSLARMHPILNRIRAHKGVDYAAPIGTPVRATSDAVVTFVGKKNGYGNVVELKHNKHISTLYGHLSRFAKGLRPGLRVSQGQTIAYVGMTGLATGPHLHYEVHVDGQYRNPLAIKTIIAEPVLDKYRPDFLAKTQPMLSQLTLLEHVMVAYRQP
jgi:murein DD-endopeptidase MepM/ murein hydrolase activator NlpD